MRKGLYGLCVAAAVAVAACTPSTEKTTAAPPADTSSGVVSEAEHVAFEPGATVMVLAGTLGAGQTARYVLGAHEGDLLMAHALSPGEDLRVAVRRLDEGAPVPDAAETETYWAGRLPVTGGYLVEVHGAGEEGPFHLELEVPRRLPLTSGASRISLAGTIQPHSPLAFAAAIEEGRALEASVTSANDEVRLTVHGARDGQTLAGWKAETNEYRGEVSATQDYVFRLDPGAEATGFELSVSVE